MLRLRALLRRAGITVDDADSQIVVGDLVLDEDSREVSRDGETILLTSTEFELLRFLAHNPRRVLSKAQILDRVWDYDFGGRSNIVELYISYLRKKIDSGREPMMTRCAAPAMSSNRPADAMVSAPRSRHPGETALVPARWSLRTRLLVGQVVLLALVCLAIGAVTEFALRNYLIGQVDEELREVSHRSTMMTANPRPPHPPGLGPGHQRRWTRQQEGPGPEFLDSPVSRPVCSQWCAAPVAPSPQAPSVPTAAAVRCRPPTSKLLAIGPGRAPVSTTIDGDGYRAVASVTPMGDTVVTALPTGRRRRHHVDGSGDHDRRRGWLRCSPRRRSARSSPDRRSHH